MSTACVDTWRVSSRLQRQTLRLHVYMFMFVIEIYRHIDTYIFIYGLLNRRYVARQLEIEEAEAEVAAGGAITIYIYIYTYIYIYIYIERERDRVLTVYGVKVSHA